QRVDLLAGDGVGDRGADDAGDGNADDVALHVDDRTARVARVHAAVDLDAVELAELVLGQARDAALTDGHALVDALAERVADDVEFLRLLQAGAGVDGQGPRPGAARRRAADAQ